MQLYRLISPVIIATLASLLALSGIAVFFADRLDTNSLASEKRMLSRLISGVPANLARLAEDNSWWDAAVENVHLTENQDWLASTLGGTVAGLDDIEGAIVLRPDNSVIYFVDGTDQPADITDLLSNGLRTAISGLKPVDADVAVSTYGYVSSNGRVFALGISMVQPSGFKVYDPPLGAQRRPVFIFYQQVHRDLIKSFSLSSELRDLSFRTGENTSPLENPIAVVPLNSINGEKLGYFVWSPLKPGAELLQQLLWPAIFLMGLIIISLASFVRRAQTLIDDLAKADRAKMAFLASMSHEVRTPLNAIIGFTEILRLDTGVKVTSEKNKEYLDIIHTSGEHLLTVINDILNISKLDAGKMEVFAAEMNPADVISESIHMIENSARERSIRVITELESATIISDERIIRQILINLLSNAIKFTSPNGQVSVRSQATTETYIITVADTGIGMSKQEIDVALAPFGQIHHDRQNTSVGTGLGLPLVNRFIALIGGNMTIRSAPGHGTSIKLEIPKALSSKASSTDLTQELLY